MRSNDNNRHTQSGRDKGASRDGKSFDNKRNSSGPREFNKGGSKFGDHKGKPSDSRSEGRDYKSNRPERSDSRDSKPGEYKPRFDKGGSRFGEQKERTSETRGGDRDYKGNRPAKDGEFRPAKSFDKKPFKTNRFTDNGRGAARSNDTRGGGYKERQFDNDENFEPKLVKKGDEKRPAYEGFKANDSLRNYKETRFPEGKNMRPRAKNAESGNSFNPNAKYSKKKQLEFNKTNSDPSKPVRLNKFLANAGLCSRREADDYIKAGVVTVNGTVANELGAKVIPATDRVLFHDQLVRSEKKVYVLLNKPKDCVTTTEDTASRTTVMDLVRNACSERIYPVGRLDRNTTGVLLLTNDGDMAARLMHPKYNKKKIYHVHLDKAVTKADLQKVADGLELEDGPIKSDNIEYVADDDKKQVGIEIHSGRNRIVRRIFEHMGYKVVKLDRVYFAGLTKKNLSRGQFRHLTEKEVSILRMGSYE